ncbi:L-glutamate gamma-semialdehyde dehydrogenase [Alkalicoccus saliphilus]|uniref:L-glutamate gamma-semialdehyde dehydrogenase n=1 Tax=Alkalicoccus saliphilus TaxID=200989 RepID=A0A2T4U982_9BACI|nr:L-glutamate gamma-semialdehyde dehydrogenase [Alkalicoccus saliphilus]PTL39937.1 L-glutamate gamma-semialdehyde dehydrogenase [Alkalicoccus saliphilus]
MYTVYQHEKFTDFTKEENRKEFLEALQIVKKDIGKEYPLVIDGKEVTTKDKLVSYNPCNTSEVIGSVSKATPKHIDDAFEAAQRAFPAWSQTDAVARAEVLFRGAAIMRRRKHELSATVVKEAGKPWKEADIEVAEAIDFLEYYGRQMVELKDGKKIESRDGESNQYIYQGVGVAVTIPPWNFSAAIMAGTTVAPLVAGNTVLLKPAEPTPIIAAKFVDIMREAGVPDGVLNFVPGEPHEIGDYLVDHPTTALITFTGSKATGLRILERAAKVQEGQQHLKTVLAEMGGKDTVVVDKEADVQTAIEAIVQGAFNFSGQKCSAGSRAVIHEDLYDEVVEGVTAETKKLTLGDSEYYENYLGPVINQKAFDKITGYIDIGKKEGRLMTGGGSDSSKGYFIEPTVFADVDPEAVINKEEIFGPVLALTKVKSYKEAIDVANNTEYGLTGAVISRNVENLEYAKKNFHVGNLYFNRNCTGAIVGYHPFGGFKLSGTDSKAGGPDYLLQYLQPKSISQWL